MRAPPFHRPIPVPGRQPGLTLRLLRARLRGMSRDSSAKFAARVPFTTVLASVVGLWLCYFLITTLRADIQDMGFPQEMLLRRGLATLVGIMVTLGLWLLLRPLDRQPLMVKLVAALLFSAPAALLVAQANQLAFADLSERQLEKIVRDKGLNASVTRSGEILVEVTPHNGETPSGGNLVEDYGTVAGAMVFDTKALRGTPFQQLAEVAYGRYFLLLAWCALYLALLSGETARAAERREGEYRRAAKAAELRSLRYQVNPHFLFNTLNSLSALVLTGKTEPAERMIQTMSTFYRRSLATDPTADVTLREEIALQMLYLDIEAVRFPQRLETVVDVPDELMDVRVPGMLLQPLVENSVKHAVAASTRKVTITLTARREGDELVLVISDDGSGGTKPAKPTVAPMHSHSIGLANVRDRLEARFGAKASMHSGPIAAHAPDTTRSSGYITTLRLPLSRAEGTH